MNTHVIREGLYYLLVGVIISLLVYSCFSETCTAGYDGDIKINGKKDVYIYTVVDGQEIDKNSNHTYYVSFKYL